MIKENKNKILHSDSVARLLPFVAQMLPVGCPGAAGKLPACCLQVADALP
jgi:hypothetical protein